MMTPYALYGLLRREGGYTIPNETAIQRGLQRLQYFIDACNNPQPSPTASIACTSTRIAKNSTSLGWLEHQKMGKLSDMPTPLRRDVREQGKELAGSSSRTFGPKRTRIRAATSPEDRWLRGWMEDPFEITAAAMKAIVATTRMTADRRHPRLLRGHQARRPLELTRTPP
jgi:hypothetical protein